MIDTKEITRLPYNPGPGVAAEPVFYGRALVVGLVLAMALGASAREARAQAPAMEIFASGFELPVAIAASPGDRDRLFVVERAGRVQIIEHIATSPTKRAEPFLDISSLTHVTKDKGMFSLAFDPDYATTGRFYVSYTNTDGGLVLARYTVSADPNVANPGGEVLLVAPIPLTEIHSGGQLAFGPDGFLYMSSGDGCCGNDPFENAQNVQVLLGKLLRLDVSPAVGYAIPTDNPFHGSPTACPEIWAIGLRNPWRFSFDRWTGALYLGDVGQEGWEEVDYLPPGAVPPPGEPFNFGWRCFEGSHPTNLPGCTYPQPYSTTDIKPVWEWSHVTNACVIGGYVYRGSAMPSLHGHYFFADFSANRIQTFYYSGAGQAELFEDRTAQLDPGAGHAISSVVAFGEDDAGELYVVSYGPGKVFRIVPDPGSIPGILPYGESTPGCSGSQSLTVNGMAYVGNEDFAFRLTNAPPSSVGLGLVTDSPDFPGSDPFGIGVALHVDLFLALGVVMLDVVSDPNGIGFAPVPIPSGAALSGVTVYAQTLSVWTQCALPPFGLSASNGLAIHIY